MKDIQSPYPNYYGRYEHVKIDDDEVITWSVLRPPDVERPVTWGYVVRKKNIVIPERE